MTTKTGVSSMIATARTLAKNELAKRYEGEFNDLVDEMMAAKGYERKTETIVKTKWVASNGQS